MTPEEEADEEAVGRKRIRERFLNASKGHPILAAPDLDRRANAVAAARPNTDAGELSLALPFQLKNIFEAPRFTFERGELAVVSGLGSVEAGYFGDGLRFEPCDAASAEQRLMTRAHDILAALHLEWSRIRAGLKTGTIQSGDGLIAVAQLVQNDGQGEPVKALGGFYIFLNENKLSTSLVLEETWEELMVSFDTNKSPEHWRIADLAESTQSPEAWSPAKQHAVAMGLEPEEFDVIVAENRSKSEED